MIHHFQHILHMTLLAGISFFDQTKFLQYTFTELIEWSHLTARYTSNHRVGLNCDGNSLPVYAIHQFNDGKYQVK